MPKLLVSISCITFNHAAYIKDCLEGFLMQRVNFKYEILINDDASVDGTQDIIKSYQKKFPNIIKPIFQEVNKYSQGQRGINFKYNFPRAQGKYIAMCEGDDYWTDPYKLQKQVDFLENNSHVVLASHNVQIVGHEYNKTINQPYYDNKPTGFYETIDLIKGFKLPTNSLLFRNGLYDFSQAPSWSKKLRSGDKFLYLMISQFGSIYYDNHIMACYRKHPEGIVGSYENWDLKKHVEIHQNQIFFWKNFKNFFYPKYQKEIKLNISDEAFQIALRSIREGIYSKLCLKYLGIALKNDSGKLNRIVRELGPIFKKHSKTKTYDYKIRFLVFGSKIKQRLLRLLS